MLVLKKNWGPPLGVWVKPEFGGVASDAGDPWLRVARWDMEEKLDSLTKVAETKQNHSSTMVTWVANFFEKKETELYVWKRDKKDYFDTFFDQKRAKYPIWEIELLSLKCKEFLNAPKMVKTWVKKGFNILAAV